MSTIKWVGGISGDWTTAADWAGGTVPGPNDTAIISGRASSAYTITLDTNVSVAGLVLHQGNATLDVSGTLASPGIDVRSGRLMLDDGTLSGTVTETGGKFLIGVGDSTLDDVTWRGVLIPQSVRARHGMPGSTLTISHGLVLTDADGTGPGSAVLSSPTILDGLTMLDDASITVSTLTISHSPTLTLGAGLTLGAYSKAYIALSKGETLINNGTLQNPQINVQHGHAAAGTFVNNGQVTGSADFHDASVTNNGTITVGSYSVVAIDLQAWQAPGAQASILLDSGTVDWQTDQELTTAQLLDLDPTQHVTVTGSYGFGVSTLDNSGAILNVGGGTKLGYLRGVSDIVGGTLAIHGTDQNLYGVTLQDLTLQSATQTLTISGSTLTNTNVVGANAIVMSEGGSLTLNGGTLSGVGSLAASFGNDLTLNGVDITGANDDGHVNISSYESTITLTSNQSMENYSLALESLSTLSLGAGASTGNADLSFDAYCMIRGSSSQSSTVSAATSVTIQGNLYLVGGSSSTPLVLQANISTHDAIYIGSEFYAKIPAYVDNTGDITITGGAFSMSPYPSTGYLANSGTIAVTDGILRLCLSHLTNTGSISVTNGTLVLADSLTLGSLTAFSDPGSQVVVAGTLDLGGRSVTAGQDGVPLFSLGGQYGDTPSIVDGTFTIAGGSVFHVDSAYAGQNFETATIGATLINNGTLIASGEPNTVFLNGAVSGTGTIEIGTKLDVTAQVGAHQIIDFSGTYGTLEFGSPAVADGFGGTLSGFHPGNVLIFSGETVASGHFSGKSIDVAFTDGGTLTLATTSALTGKLLANGDLLYYQIPESIGLDGRTPTTFGVTTSDLVSPDRQVSGNFEQDGHPALHWLSMHPF